MIVWRMLLRPETWRIMIADFKHKRSHPTAFFKPHPTNRTMLICTECGYETRMDEIWEAFFQEQAKAELNGTIDEFEEKWFQ